MKIDRTSVVSEFNAMWSHLLKALPLVLILMLLTAVGVLAATGTTDSPSTPGNSASQMYTLEQIYNLLDTGLTTNKMTSFSEPSVSPGTGTMHTLDDIMAAAQGNRCNCVNGTLNGTRWCDNGDGTVTDLLGYDGKGQCLVWLKDAGCFGKMEWVDSTNWDGAQSQTGILYDGSTNFSGSDCSLSDGSIGGDWQLPTKSELIAITNTSGTEWINSANMHAFTGVQSDVYWSSTSRTDYPTYALFVDLSGDYWNGDGGKSNAFYIWPVRGGQ